MKLHISFLITFFCLPFQSFAFEPTTIWAKAWGGTDFETNQILSLDNEGNIFVAGNTRGTFKLGETTIVNSKSSNSTSYIAKYTPVGELIWVKGGGTGNYLIEGIASDNSGNAYIAGYFQSPILNLGEFSLTNPNPNSYTFGRGFIAKYSPTGDVIWAIALNTDIYNRIHNLAIGNDRSLYIIGKFKDNQLVFGDVSIQNPNINPDPELNIPCTFLFKLDLDGKALWGKSYGDNSIVALTVDKDENIILGGSFKSSTIHFDNITLQNPNIGLSKTFITKLSTGGQYLWAKSISSNGPGYCQSIATDIDGNIYSGGSFSATTLNVDDLSLIYNNKTSRSFLLKCNPEGNALWIKSSNDGEGNNFNTICIDKYKNVYVSGGFDGDISIDGISLTNEMSKGTDMVILKYKSDGTIVWAKNYGGDESMNANTCLIDNKGDIHISGEFASKEIYFDKFRVNNFTSNTQEQNQQPFSTTDAFLIKLKQPVDTITVRYCSTNNTAVLSVDDPAKSYNWMNSSGQSIGDKSELTINNPVVGDTYSCHITYHNGSSQTLSTTVIENKLIADFKTITDCKSNNIQFSERITSSHFPTEIKWEFGDGTNSTQSYPNHTYNNAGKYIVRLEVSNPLSACAEIIEKEIEVFEMSAFTATPKQIDSRNNKIELSAAYNPSLQYIYDLGDGTTKSGANNIHTYQIDNSKAEYIIKLTTINEINGCINEYTESIDVVPFIPNVFTPNADGINDIFAPNVDLQIIDRNGINIYQGKNGWDGNYKGAEVPADTYFYLMKYTDKHGEIQTKKGAVSLIR